MKKDFQLMLSPHQMSILYEAVANLYENRIFHHRHRGAQQGGPGGPRPTQYFGPMGHNVFGHPISISILQCIVELITAVYWHNIAIY